MILLVIALFLATIITRILPAVMVGKKNLPEDFVVFLNFIPYAALGVLIFPGILTAVDSPLHGILGGIFAVVLAVLRVPLFLIVVGAIVFVYLII